MQLTAEKAGQTEKKDHICELDNNTAHNIYNELHVRCPSHTTERKLVTKIDVHVIPFLCILYLLAFLDRVNIANANVFGLSKELDLSHSNRYNTALVIFFVPYVLFEIPSNVLLKRFQPHVWLSACTFLFGLASVCQGLVKSYEGLLTTRFFLGLFESGMFPGCFYLIGMWYRRHEAQKRFTFFFSSTTLAGAFGGLLASAIGKMDGVRGYRGWRWIFILEGLLTCVASLIFYFTLPSFPEHAKWLTEQERVFVQARLQIDQGNSAAERKMTLKDIRTVFKDPKIFAGGFMYFSLIVTAYGYAYFSPTIIQGYGYSPIQTQLHSVPPWAAAFVFAMIVAYASDRFQHRFLFAVVPLLISISGLGILLTEHTNTRVMYAALFLVALVVYTAMPIVVCWFNMNLGGHHRRSVGSAWQIGFGNIGGIISVFAFLREDAPKYTKGYAICLSFVIFGMITCVAYYLACLIQNRNRDNASRDTASVLTDLTETDLGDMSKDYRYLL